MDPSEPLQVGYPSEPYRVEQAGLGAPYMVVSGKTGEAVDSGPEGYCLSVCKRLNRSLALAEATG